MEKQKSIIIIITIGLIGLFVLPMACTSTTVKDGKNKNITIICTRRSIQFRFIDDQFTWKASSWIEETNNNIPGDINARNQLLLKISKEIKLPNNLELLFQFERNSKTNKLYPSYIIALQKTVVLTGNDISEAKIVRDDYGMLNVNFKTTSEGRNKLAEATSSKNYGRRLAIIVDNKIRSTPRIIVQIVSGNASITGNFTMDEVKDLVKLIQKSTQ